MQKRKVLKSCTANFKIFEILSIMFVQFLFLINTTPQIAPKNSDSTVSLEHSITFEQLTAKTVTTKSVC